MWFKDITYLEVWRHLFSAEQKTIVQARGHYEEQFCKIILNLEQWVRRKCRLEIFILSKA